MNQRGKEAQHTTPHENGKAAPAGRVTAPLSPPAGKQGTHRVPMGGTRGRAVLTDPRAIRLHTEMHRRRMRLVMVLAGLLVAFAGVAVVGVFVVGGGVISTVTGEVGGIFETPVPQLPRLTSGPDMPEGTPPAITYPDWDKKEPVNILLIGLDEREGVEDIRTDTQIIVHIDPTAKTAALVSLPRDLWVEIPGHGEDRINAAYKIGEKERKGSGPALAKATVRENLGIPIHYYATVNFQGFEQVIDTIQGITIDVQRPLVDNQFPFQEFGATRVYIPAGLQHMDGRTALQYARSRHADSDIGRNARQQQVLLAIKEQGLSLNLLAHITELAEELGDAVRTDLLPLQIGSLAQLSRSIDADSIQTVVISGNMIRETTLPSGANVLIPRWDLIRPAITQAFSDPRLGEEAARLSVKNGTWTAGLAREVRDELAELGVYVADLSNAEDRGQHPVTTVTDFTGGQKRYTLETVVTLLGMSLDDVKEAPESQAPIAADGSPVDILVVIGDDRIEE
ncbi:MAG: LCP family protein [Chloroflexota bacterium]|nr:LCP family protein [Chloroflexota bacterium]MDQ5867496.1 LCP family protein [Chloroflexota bacterium]